MEKLADEWVKNCVKEKPDPTVDQGYDKTLSTMWISSEAKEPSINEITSEWEAEKKFYNYASNSCSGACPNYIQLIWARSFQIGCAKNKCDGKTTKDKKPFYIFACVYKNDFYKSGMKPYESGPSCDSCRSICHLNQCPPSKGR
nr:hypothetical transcript [Hymenolepis microstoma]